MKSLNALRRKKFRNSYEFCNESLSESGELKITFSMNKRTMSQVADLKFDKDEMILVEPDGTKTRHHRHEGQIPEEFLW